MPSLYSPVVVRHLIETTVEREVHRRVGAHEWIGNFNGDDKEAAVAETIVNDCITLALREFIPNDVGQIVHRVRAVGIDTFLDELARKMNLVPRAHDDAVADAFGDHPTLKA